MATLKDAEQAREQAGETLRGLGAHAISVEEEPPDEDEAAQNAAAGATGALEGLEPTEGLEATDDAALGGGSRRRPRRRTFAVVAWFAEEPPADLPQALEVRAGTRKKVVPLRARRAERFRAE